MNQVSINQFKKYGGEKLLGTNLLDCHPEPSKSKLQEMLENKDFTLVNVHIPWQGDIPKTDSQIPYDQINENLENLPANKDAKIMIYCLTSGMAKIAVQSLLELGYTNLWMLEGGTTTWEEAGLTLNKE